MAAPPSASTCRSFAHNRRFPYGPFPRRCVISRYAPCPVGRFASKPARQGCAAAVAFGLAFYACFGLTPAYLAKVFSPDRSTLIFGIANVFTGAGFMIGNVVGGWSKALSGTLVWVYIGVGAIAALLIPITLLLPKEDEGAPTVPVAGETICDPARPVARSIGMCTDGGS